VLIGAGDTTRTPTPTGIAHLAPLRARLERDSLEEYCFMIWGLSEQQLKILRSTVSKFGLVPRTTATQKK